MTLQAAAEGGNRREAAEGGRVARCIVLEAARRAREALDEGARAVSAGQTEVAGTRHLTVPNAFGDTFLPELLRVLRARHSASRFELGLSIARRDRAADGFDRTVRPTRTVDEALVARPLGVIRDLVVVAPRTLRDARAAAHTRGARRVSGAPQPPLRRRSARVSASGESRAVAGPLGIISGSAPRPAARAGAGIGRLPRRRLVAERASRALTPIPAEDPHTATPTRPVYPARRHQPYRLRALEEFLRAALEDPRRRALFR